MSRSNLSALLAFAILSLSASAAQAQTQASCTFTSFGLGVNIPVSGPGFIAPVGINDFGTIVGTAIPSNDQEPSAAFVRWANGGYAFPLGTSFSAISSTLTDRNDNGISIGAGGILLNGTTVTNINLNGLAAGQQLQDVNGINNWGSIVGTYFTDFPNGLTGFKRWSNGGFITLNFPGGLPTTPMSINDNGVVVGSYSGGGFIYSNGQWATLKFPKSTNTVAVGIDNAGTIVGNALMPDGTETPFLYEDGTFKVIAVPNATANSTTVFGISPRLGLIVGNGFIAKCQ